MSKTGEDRPGWAAQVLAGVGGDVTQLRALTLNLPPGTGDNIPDARVLDVLKHMLREDYGLTLGAWVLDWGPVVGWHAHGLATFADAERLAALPGRHDLEVKSIYDLPGWVRYMTKAGRKSRVPSEESLTYSTRMDRIRAALPGRRRVNSETGELLELTRQRLPSRVVAFLPDFGATSTDALPVGNLRDPLSHLSPCTSPHSAPGADVQGPPPAAAEAVRAGASSGCSGSSDSFLNNLIPQRAVTEGSCLRGVRGDSSPAYDALPVSAPERLARGRELLRAWGILPALSESGLPQVLSSSANSAFLATGTQVSGQV